MLASSCFGDTNKPALVLLHGFLGDKHDWQDLMPLLSQHFYCVCLDLPGHGDSPDLKPVIDSGAKTSGFMLAAQQIAQTLAVLQINTFHLLGYSLGGRIALHLSQLMPQKILSVTLESCHPGLTDETLKRQRQLNDQHWNQQLSSLSIEAFLALWYQQGVFAELSQQKRSALITRRRHNRTTGLQSIYLPTSLALQQDLHQLPNQSPVPWHYFVGQQDGKFSALAERWQQQASIAIHYFADAGHNVHLACSDAFCHTLINSLLKEDS
ncbi:2-succinyl-6-hydroxy-2,4-cyclohexadiene-1-carboxylate synthase [Shewanella sp. Isolate11]|uniref:2-succinyl-6-hydroxy-2, 4-cyclohexadiene-1-carboxylate synthase n=1 Tax=Shewanella sp. Isolate11 TaxID=2908530 RepID=UPI001EFECD7C|nr:2-succinyl-6-hydroxy-2,4-cyclohexadiene-1-carboxylate synthase [Shewanella sp. Isolate11]MCG9697892.1 2-succinyl-6-hydroxy-2,4-cyclohexadiene-1-carboxylate synthase [Shewanella sp. Isolate11]